MFKEERLIPGIAGGEPKGRVSWWAAILGAATLVLLSYAGFAQRGNEEQQAGLLYFCAGFLILLMILLALLDVLRRRRGEELTANPEDKDVKSQ